MASLKDRLRQADRIPAPDLWSDILSREPSPKPDRSRSLQVVTVALALAFAAGAIFLLARAFLPKTRVTNPAPSVTTLVQPVAENGKVAFVRANPKTVHEGHTPESTIYTIEPNGSGLVELAAGVNYRSTPAWSPDGQRIAFVRSDGLYVMNSNGRGSSRLVTCQPSDCQGIGSPAWSPDGLRIAFPSSRNGKDDLWVVGSDGSGLTPIREHLTVLGSPSWSPDGQNIAVTGYLGANTGQHSILILNAESGEMVRTISIAGIEFSESVSWSPDGQWLAASATGTGGSSKGEGIYLTRPDGSDSRLLTSCPASPNCIDVYPAWSPDGHDVAFTRGLCSQQGSDCFTGDVYVIDVETGRSQPLTSGPALDCCPSWQPLKNS
jgi:Tol biopolymer transport system component